jgi:RNA polymerase sigma-70 factor (ECF subfamily)
VTPPCATIRRQPDGALIERARKGDPEAFAELTNGLEPLMLARAHGITGNWADAEDAVQEAMWRAYSRFHTYREEASFSAWLTRITVNQALLLLRSQRSRPVLVAGDMHCEEQPDPAADSEQTHYAAELRAHVHAAISRLPKGYRRLMRLWAFEELGYAEMGRQLGMSIAVVKSRIYRGRIALRRSLAWQLGRDVNERKTA